MRARWRAHHSATTFDSENGGHGAKSAFAHPTDSYALPFLAIPEPWIMKEFGEGEAYARKLKESA
jgi:hypothetical protein